MNRLYKLFTLSAFALLINSSFVRFGCYDLLDNKCVPALKPYLHNGQVNSATISAGERASTVLSFYSGNTYRISSCVADQNDQVHFEVRTAKSGKLLYSSKGKEKASWDFKLEASRKLVVDVIASDELKQKACVGISVGFLE